MHSSSMANVSSGGKVETIASRNTRLPESRWPAMTKFDKIVNVASIIVIVLGTMYSGLNGAVKEVQENIIIQQRAEHLAFIMYLQNASLYQLSKIDVSEHDL